MKYGVESALALTLACLSQLPRCGVQSSLGPNIGSRDQWHRLIMGGLLLAVEGALECRPVLQASPVGLYAWRELFGEAQMLRQLQGVANGNVGGGEAHGAEIVGLGQSILDRTQTGQEPALIVVGYLRL